MRKPHSRDCGVLKSHNKYNGDNWCVRPDEDTIKISPNLLVLDSGGIWITIHTNCDYYEDGKKVEVTVSINSVPLDPNLLITFPDDCGYLVVKIRRNTITLVEGDNNLAVTTDTGFDAEDYIVVKE